MRRSSSLSLWQPLGLGASFPGDREPADPKARTPLQCPSPGRKASASFRPLISSVAGRASLSRDAQPMGSPQPVGSRPVWKEPALWARSFLRAEGAALEK